MLTQHKTPSRIVLPPGEHNTQYSIGKYKIWIQELLKQDPELGSPPKFDWLILLPLYASS